MLDVDAARAAEAVPGRIAVTGCALPASPCDHRPMDRRRVVVSVVFYCGLTTVWLSILLDLFHRVLPSEIATRIGYNSEGVVLALVLGAWIQFVRPRLVGTQRGAVVALAVAAGFLLFGLWLLNTDQPTKLKTLNEAWFGVGILICYLQARRPLPPWLAPGLAVAVLGLIGVSIATELDINLAETAGMCLLAPIALDVVDKGILDPLAATSDRLRYAWYSVLIVVPIVSSSLWHSRVFSPDTVAYRVNNYEVRLQEAFVGMLLIELFFAVGLGRLGPRDDAPGHRPDAERIPGPPAESRARTCGP